MLLVPKRVRQRHLLPSKPLQQFMDTTLHLPLAVHYHNSRRGLSLPVPGKDTVSASKHQNPYWTCGQAFPYTLSTTPSPRQCIQEGAPVFHLLSPQTLVCKLKWQGVLAGFVGRWGGTFSKPINPAHLLLSPWQMCLGLYNILHQTYWKRQLKAHTWNEKWKRGLERCCNTIMMYVPTK